MEDPKVALVVASNREDRFREFVDVWHGESGFPWDVTILVQDGGGERFQPADDTPLRRWKGIARHDWASIEAARQDRTYLLPDWMSRNDSGIKAWGFLVAVLEHKADVVITLDDDCLPSTLGVHPSCRRDKDGRALSDIVRYGFVGQHLAALGRTRRWTTTIPGFVPRGMPYGTDDAGRQQPRAPRNSLGDLPVMLNMGVWAEIPDRDAVHELTNWTADGDYRPWKPRRSVYGHSRVMSSQQHWPMCGMNLAFRREVAPLMYFPRMGKGSPFRRFDDIWCGVIAQKCLAHLGLACAVGGPIIDHVKASRPMDNLVGESPGIRANEEFWRLVDRIPLGSCESTPLHCMYWIGDRLAQYNLAEVADETLRGYVPRLGAWIRQWCDEFRKAGWP